jgi:hypothetical protein
LEALEPDHPLVAVFKSLFISSVEELVTQAETHDRKLYDSPGSCGRRRCGGVGKSQRLDQELAEL